MFLRFICFGLLLLFWFRFFFSPVKVKNHKTQRHETSCPALEYLLLKNPTLGFSAGSQNIPVACTLKHRNKGEQKGGGWFPYQTNKISTFKLNLIKCVEVSGCVGGFLCLVWREKRGLGAGLYNLRRRGWSPRGFLTTITITITSLEAEFSHSFNLNLL